MIRATPKPGRGAFCQRQASLINKSSPSARPSIFPFEGGTVEFEAIPSLAASFSVPRAIIAILAIQKRVSVDLPSIFRHFQGGFGGLL